MTASPLETTQLILDALNPQYTATSWKIAAERRSIDWDDLIVRAIVLGLAPQVYRRVSEWGLSLPARGEVKLTALYQSQIRRTEAIFLQLDEFLGQCEKHRLRPLALKGIHLAVCHYPEPAMRPMNDVDLLFTAGELPIAESILLDLGYSARYKSPEMGAGVTKHTSTFRRPSKDDRTTANPYLSTRSDRTIEPHASLEESWLGLSVDITPGVRERAEPIMLGARECHGLALEDLLLHLCLHCCFHLIQGSPAMVQVSDLLAVTRTGELNWREFTRRARDYRASQFALAGLSLAQKLLGAPVPPTALGELSANTPSALRHRIERLGLADVLRRTQQDPLNSIAHRIWRGLGDRAETARWAPDWRGRLQVWRTLFQPLKSDTGQLILRRLRR